MNNAKRDGTETYFSADVETDGPIPGRFSMLSFGLVCAGHFDGQRFVREARYDHTFYRELRPISDIYDDEALRVSGLDRDRLQIVGTPAEQAMTEAAEWIRDVAGSARPILVAYPLSFDWLWLYWYFVRFAEGGSPFDHSGAFDIKTAYAAKARTTITQASRSKLPPELRSTRPHTHNALEDAIEQAEIFANLFEWVAPTS